MEVSGQIHVTGALIPGNEPPLPNELKSEWVPRASLDVSDTRKITDTCQNSSPAQNLITIPTRQNRQHDSVSVTSVTTTHSHLKQTNIKFNDVSTVSHNIFRHYVRSTKQTTFPMLSS